MIEIIYKSIPGLLFEPIAVAALLGLAVASVMYWKRHERFYWIFAVAIVFMISWRTAIEIISGRYAAILIYPGILATAFFCFQTEWLVKYIPKFPEKWRKIVPWLFVIGLGIASLVKTLHFNPYSDHIIKAAHVIKKDAACYRNPVVIVTHQEVRRIRYYSNLMTHGFTLNKEDNIKTRNSLYSSLDWYSLFGDAVYIVSFEQNKTPAGYQFSQIPEFIQCNIELIGEFYQNRKKKRMTRVYRYNVADAWRYSFLPCSNIQETDGLIRYVFRDTPPADPFFYEKVKKHYSVKKDFQIPEIKRFPQKWVVAGADGYKIGCNAKLDFVDGVLIMKSDSLAATYHSDAIPAKSYRLRMIVSGAPGTCFSLCFYGYDAKAKWQRCYHLPYGKITQQGMMEYQLTVPEGFFDGTKSLRPLIRLVKGELRVHRIDLY